MPNAISRKAASLSIALLLSMFPQTSPAVELYYLTIYAGKASQATTLRDRYLQLVRTRIEESRRYPLAARKLGQEGRVLVRFVVAADGGLQEVELRESCGTRSLDEAALAAVRAAAPFPAPPEEVFPDSAAMQIVIAFALR